MSRNLLAILRYNQTYLSSDDSHSRIDQLISYFSLTCRMINDMKFAFLDAQFL